MTSSRLDKQILVWEVRSNITDDIKSQSSYKFETESGLNQICLVNNSNTLAAATETGIELFDMNKGILK